MPAGTLDFNNLNQNYMGNSLRNQGFNGSNNPQYGNQ
jgi:hypothetical protein